MLVYFDPWIAGVIMPTLIIVGLMAIPYIDTNPKGNGYYTFKERKAEIVIFLFGFAVLWVSLIVLGTFLRGPNWNFFGPFEYWSPYKVEVLNNVDLPQMFWVNLLNKPQWGNPNTNINGTSFGRVTTATGNRVITFNARFDF